MKSLNFASGSMHVYAQRTHWGSVEIRMMCNLVPGNKPAAARQVEFVEAAEGEYIEPALVLGHDTAQMLIDELWRAGLRPTEGAGSAGQLASTERHLSDMRTIAFHKLGIKGNE